MCGITGLFGNLEPGDQARVAAMSEALAHRGPDAANAWAHEAGGRGAIFGHRRLSIIDLRPCADQPLIHGPTGCALVFNGEIYNYKELRRELEALGHAFVTDGDSEAILIGYVQWGEGVVARLRGMFAFALHDPRDAATLIARDGFGIKPMYLAEVPGRGGPRALAFASELRALLASGLVGRSIDVRRIHDYLWNGYVAGSRTIVPGIVELPPGSYARVAPGDVAVRPVRFWSPAMARPAPMLSAEEGMAAIAESVALHLQADVKLGVFLSGGIDSSAVAALAARAAPGVETLAIGFEDRATDESKVAAEVARRLGTHHHTVLISPEEMLAHVDAAVAAFDQPTMDAVNSWFVSRAARAAGWKVALAGSGGDELLGGYTSFRRLPRLAPLLAKLPAALGAPAGRLFGLLDGGFSARAKSGDLLATGGDPARIYQTLYGLLPRRTLRGFLADPVAADGWGLDPAELDSLADDIAGLSPLRQVSVLESRLFLGSRLLRDTDAVSMAHSIEARMPLVDTVLSDTLAAVPDDVRYALVGAKPLLRRIAIEAVGAEIFDRPKQGFVFPFETWLRGPLKAAVGEVLLDAEGVRAMGLRPDRVAALWHAFLGFPGRIYWTRIWAFYVLLRWAAINRIGAGG